MTAQLDDLVADLGVVVVAHARVDYASRCLQTLPEGLPTTRVVVVINDPGATDQLELEDLADSGSVVSPARPQGFGANLNLGVAMLPQGVRYLLLANDDVEFLQGSVPWLLETLRDDPQVGIVGPRLLQLNGKEPPLQPQFPTALRAALNMTILPLGPAWAWLSRRAGVFATDDPSELAPNGWVIGAAMAVRAEAFRVVGGFDEDFFLYYEETDFCYRVRRAGWRIAWRPDAVVRHVHAGSTAAAALEGLFFQSERLYYRKRLGLVRSSLLQLGLVALYLTSCLYNAGSAVARPATRRQRFALLRERWRIRIFLRGRYRAPG